MNIARALPKRERGDTKEKWFRMLRYSSHLSVQGYDSFLQTWADEGFSAETTNFFSRGLPTVEAMTWSAKVITGDTIFLAMLRLLIFSH